VGNTFNKGTKRLKILGLRAKGHSFRKIAEKCGITHRSVMLHLRSGYSEQNRALTVEEAKILIKLVPCIF